MKRQKKQSTYSHLKLKKHLLRNCVLCATILSLSVLASCKKVSNSLFDLSTSTTPVLFPSKVVFSTNVINAYNNYGLGPITFYNYIYNPNLLLFQLNVRYGTATADSIYNKVSYDNSGRIQSLGTNNNNALIITYSATGDVSKISQAYLLSGINTTDVRNFTYSSGQITQSNKFIAGSSTPAINNTFITDANGNITSANLTTNGVSTPTTIAYYGSTLPNPFYNLSKNNLLAFLPEQLWANIEFIVFSKNLIQTIDSTGNQTQTFTYQFDNYNRITIVTNTINVLNSTTPIVITYTLSYAN